MGDVSKSLAGSAAKVITNVTAASMTGDPGDLVKTAITETIGFGADAFVAFSTRRSKELFDTPELITQAVAKIHESDNYAALIYNLWQKYNLESSERRRGYLKQILTRAVNENVNDFDNFTRIITIADQISDFETVVLNAFYSFKAHNFVSDDRASSAKNYSLNLEEILKLLASQGIKPWKTHLAVALNQLGHFGLVLVKYNALNGPYYSSIDFGKTFLAYVHDN